MRKGYLIAVLIFIYGGVRGQITQWTFETSMPTTAGPHAAEVGIGSASGLHTSGSVFYSNPVGNGSIESFSSNFWAPGDYYQFQFPTTGYQNISITWDATSSNTGPRDFKVQYSPDGVGFTDATGANSTYSVANDNWSSTPPSQIISTRTLNLNLVTILNNVPAVYIRLVCNSPTAVNASPIATGGTSRVDNFTVNGNAISSNTISVDAVSALTFNIDCFTDGTGSVDFSSVGIFNIGNDYSAELSDATGSFASPIVIGTLIDNTANSGTITIAIPAGTPTGVGYRIRVVSNDPVVSSSNTSAAISINLTGICISLATDFYRSKNSGDWNLTTTWQSSVSGLAGTWINATLTPTSAANTILIRNGHTVSITSTESADQVIIENGGVLNQASGVFTIDGGTGDDVDIQNGGVFTLSFTNNPPVFGAGNPVVNISTGGILRVSAGGLTSAAPANGVNVANYVYQHQSILEFTLNGAFVTAGNAVYFPNVNASTIPIFRTTANSPTVLNVGAGTPTTFNGIFEAGGTATIRWQNAGNKIFRNGIRGQGNIDFEAASIASAKFIINGTTAELGGTGSLIVPTTGGLEIGSASGTTVFVSANKTVTGDISLLPANTFVELGNFNLTVSGIVSGGTSNYIKTNGTGSLILQGITGLRNAPIGNSSYNPLVITNTSGHDWTLRVEDVLTVTDPDFASNTAKAVNREWHISPSVNPPATGADIVFQYNDNPLATPRETGTLYTTTENVQIWREVGTDWIAVGVAQVASGVPNGIRTANISNWSLYSPFAISNISGPLPVKLISFKAVKVSSNLASLTWELAACCSKFATFEVQKSSNGRDFSAFNVVQGSETNRFYLLNDSRPGKGVIYYRLKMIDADGSVSFSKIIAIINDNSGLLITALTPNPVRDITTVSLSMANAGMASFIIYDISGHPVKQWQAMLTEGSNTILVGTNGLAAGIYHLAATSGDAKTVMRFVKQ